MRRDFVRVFVIATLVGVVAAPFFAPSLQASALPRPGLTDGDIKAAMEGAGLTVTEAKDSDGLTLWRCETEKKSRFIVIQYRKEDEKEASSLQVVAAWDTKDAPAWDLLNVWNSQVRMTKTYLDDEKDPVLAENFRMSTMSKDELKASFTEFAAVVPVYEEVIVNGGGTAAQLSEALDAIYSR